MVDLGRRKTNHAAYWLTAIAFASLVTKVWPLLLFFNPLSVCAILNKRATVGAKLVSGTICHDIQGTLRHGQCSGTRRERSRRCARPQASSSMTRVPLPAEGRTIQQKDGAPCRFRTPLNRCYMSTQDTGDDGGQREDEGGQGRVGGYAGDVHSGVDVGDDHRGAEARVREGKDDGDKRRITSAEELLETLNQSHIDVMGSLDEFLPAKGSEARTIGDVARPLMTRAKRYKNPRVEHQKRKAAREIAQTELLREGYVYRGAPSNPTKEVNMSPREYRDPPPLPPAWERMAPEFDERTLGVGSGISQRSRKMRARWQDPEYRARCLAGRKKRPGPKPKASRKNPSSPTAAEVDHFLNSTNITVGEATRTYDMLSKGERIRREKLSLRFKDPAKWMANKMAEAAARNAERNHPDYLRKRQEARSIKAKKAYAVRRLNGKSGKGRPLSKVNQAKALAEAAERDAAIKAGLATEADFVVSPRIYKKDVPTVKNRPGRPRKISRSGTMAATEKKNASASARSSRSQQHRKATAKQLSTPSDSVSRTVTRNNVAIPLTRAVTKWMAAAAVSAAREFASAPPAAAQVKALAVSKTREVTGAEGPTWTREMESIAAEGVEAWSQAWEKVSPTKASSLSTVAGNAGSGSKQRGRPRKQARIAAVQDPDSARDGALPLETQLSSLSQEETQVGSDVGGVAVLPRPSTRKDASSDLPKSTGEPSSTPDLASRDGDTYPTSAVTDAWIVAVKDWMAAAAVSAATDSPESPLPMLQVKELAASKTREVAGTSGRGHARSLASVAAEGVRAWLRAWSEACDAKGVNSSNASVPSDSPAPKRRGRPRKSGIEVSDVGRGPASNGPLVKRARPSSASSSKRMPATADKDDATVVVSPASSAALALDSMASKGQAKTAKDGSFAVMSSVTKAVKVWMADAAVRASSEFPGMPPTEGTRVEALAIAKTREVTGAEGATLTRQMVAIVAEGVKAWTQAWEGGPNPIADDAAGKTSSSTSPRDGDALGVTDPERQDTALRRG